MVRLILSIYTPGFFPKKPGKKKKVHFLILMTLLLQANAGDSRSVLGVKGRAKPLSFDHKPHNEGSSIPCFFVFPPTLFRLLPELALTFLIGEKARISAAGGFVDFGRVNGNLALSRAIGDFEFKKSADLAPEQQVVTAYPDVTSHEITEDDEFLVIACDGMYLSPFFFFLLSLLLTERYRNMGLPVFTGRHRICQTRNCRKTRIAPNL